MTGEIAAGLQVLLTRSKLVLVKSDEVLGKTEGGDRTQVLSVFERMGCCSHIIVW
jgi:nuclear pore complex protein Nup188